MTTSLSPALRVQLRPYLRHELAPPSTVDRATCRCGFRGPRHVLPVKIATDGLSHLIAMHLALRN